MRQKLVVVSMDALFSEDLEYLKTKPAFSRFLKQAARVTRVRSVYPTLTYPCHATMLTGCWPEKHGVLANTRLQPGVRDPDWLWYHDAYRVPDLIDAAKAVGLTTAAVGWPTLGNHPHLDWIVAEIAHTRARTEAEFRADYLRTGTTPELWDAVCRENIHYRTREKSVAMFNASVCCALLRTYRPDVTVLHTGSIDSARHKYGVHAPEVLRALDEHETILASLLDAIQDAGTADCTNLVVTADHGQMDIVRAVRPNALFAENGFCSVSSDGTLLSWRAWSVSNGMSACVYVKDPADEAAVLALLRAHADQGWEHVYTKEEAAAFGCAGDFSFVLETDGKTGFSDAWTGPFCTELDRPMGKHGFHPDKGPRPPIAAVGPSFRPGAVLSDADLIDGAPTWARVLGFTLPDAQGRVLEELLI